MKNAACPLALGWGLYATVMAAAAPPEEVDARGDPLPARALRRLGSMRWRHGGRVTALAFSPNGKWLASGGDDCSVRLWEVPSGKQKYCLSGRGGDSHGHRFTPDGNTLACLGNGFRIDIVDVASGKQTRWLTKRPGIFTAAAYTADGKILVTGGSDGTLSFWDISTGKSQRDLKAHRDRVLALACAPGGKLLASSGTDRVVRLWDGSGKELRRLEGHNGQVWSLSFAADGKRLLTGSDDGTARLWDVATGKELGVGRLACDRLACFSPDSKTIAVWRTRRAFVCTRRPRGGSCAAWREPWRACLPRLPSRRMASGWRPATRYRPVHLWDSATGKCSGDQSGQHGAVTAVAWLSDGKRLAVGGGRTVKLWDAAKGKELWTSSRPSQRVRLPVLAAGDKRLAAGYSGVRLRDSGHRQAIAAATGGGQRRRHQPGFLSRRSAPGHRQLQGHGERLGHGHEQGAAPVEGSAFRDLLPRFVTRRNHPGHGDAGSGNVSVGCGVRQQVANATGTGRPLWPFPRWSAAGADRTSQNVLLWELATGRPRFLPRGYLHLVACLAFSADGRTLIIGDAGGSLRFWELPRARSATA